MPKSKLAFAFLVCACAVFAQPMAVIHGTWTATIGPRQVLHGTWTGHALSGRPDAAEGTWELVSAGQVVRAGSWRAEKTHRAWEGVWSGRTMDGQSLSGTWGADLDTWSGKTFQDLLERTLQEEVSGWWQSGRDQGYWWLKGSPSAGAQPQRTPTPSRKPH